ncbi:hypothetical protein GGS21DRAFT_495369 [Xylaria nigripes]|nr:hypothetical protein GGS21DRAFT_495369 [Xylaria nigripes]
MQLRQYLNALATALPLLASPALSDLAPWHVTGISTFSPSGRPGSSTEFYNYANITNPDPTQTETDPEITQGKVSCKLVWQYPDVPYSQAMDCEILDTTVPSPWIWTVEFLKRDNDTNPINNFDLRWRAAPREKYPSESHEGLQIWTGAGHFKVGQNMDFLCAASGFCSGGLKATSNPALINVTTVSCHGTLEEALSGINCD